MTTQCQHTRHQAHSIDHQFLVAAVMLVCGVKIAILWTFWDDRLGDYWRLEAFADIILRSKAWLTNAGIDREAFPPELYKTPGYPLLIAAMKISLGENWARGLFVLSSIISFIAGLFVRKLALALGFGSALATIAFILFEFSVPASTDVIIMPDGLYGSLAIIAICVTGAEFLVGGTISLRNMLVAGFLVAGCFFLREGFVYFVIPIGLALCVPVWLSGSSPRRAVVLMLAICLPAYICAAGVITWNKYRSGHYMIANVSQVVYMTNLMILAEKQKSIFSGNEPLDVAARATFMDYNYGDAQNVTIKLFNDYGIKAPEADRITRDRFWRVVADDPVAFTQMMIERFRLRQQASMIGSLLTRLDDLDYWRQVIYGKDYYEGWRGVALKARESGDWNLLTIDIALKMAARAASYAATLVLFLAFVVILPGVAAYESVRFRGYGQRRALFLLGLYLFYWCFFAAHLLVTVEIRYFGAICAAPILSSLYLLMQLRRTGGSVSSH